MEALLVYPNKMDFPIMENFGIVPPPLGMLEVRVSPRTGPEHGNSLMPLTLGLPCTCSVLAARTAK